MQHIEQLVSEIAKLEQKAADQARFAIDEMARVGKEYVAYGAQLSGEWRKFVLEAGKRVSELMTPKA